MFWWTGANRNSYVVNPPTARQLTPPDMEGRAQIIEPVSKKVQWI